MKKMTDWLWIIGGLILAISITLVALDVVGVFDKTPPATIEAPEGPSAPPEPHPFGK
ncbi:MAG: hypothetical protein HY559_03980 [Gammaproteobacteria bacterium]|nr:hypothetical protein [Gammaproteobacteria bacterium]